ncbi:Metalloprotease PmbA [subsurface metagenome]
MRIKSLTITDNPLIDFSRDACPISNEGVPTKITPLVENGILKSFLYDLDSAGLDNAEPTGHNACTPYNLCVKPGEKTGEQLILEIDDGIYINDLMGFGQSNIMNGDFSCNLGLGFRIKNGKIVGRIKNVMVSGNIYELFKNNLVLSSDTEPTIHMPYAVIEGLNVS